MNDLKTRPTADEHFDYEVMAKDESYLDQPYEDELREHLEDQGIIDPRLYDPYEY